MRVQGFFAPLSTVSPDGIGDRLRNAYREDTGDPDRPSRYVRRPGLGAWVTGLNGPVRGGVELDGQCDVIAGEEWYDIDANGVATLIGTVAPDTRPAMMISNGTAGNQTAGISGGKLYVRDRQAGTFEEVTDTDLPADILGIVHTDTYAVAWFQDSRAIRISDLLDFTTWAGGDVAERSQYVDNIVSVIADQTEIVLLGSQSQETWWNSGNNAFPFEPVPNALTRQGAAATHSACLVGDSPYWVSKSPEGIGPVLRVRGGYTPERISTHYIERKIQALYRISDAYSYSYEEMGHRFYVLTFPSADVTLAFDEAVNPAVAWSEWTYMDPRTGQHQAHLGRCHFFAFGKHLVGSRRDGTIYEQSLSTYSDAGDPIRTDLIFKGPSADGKRVFIDRAYLDAQTGVGLTSGQGSDPRVMLRKSKDGGHTWGPELWRSLGAKGDYGRRVEWHRMGAADDPAWWLSYTDPTMTGFNYFGVDATKGAH